MLGPTASGKSAWAYLLAHAFDFEIINADSRQVYGQLQIGTAKPKGEWRAHPQTGERVYMVEDIPHYLMDVIDPAYPYTVAEWKVSVETRAREIVSRNKKVLFVGGTGLYLDALTENFEMPVRDHGNARRIELQKKPLVELVRLLREYDATSAARVDIKNQRRVLRALEVVLATGESFVAQQKKQLPQFDAFKLGVRVPMEELTHRINARVDMMTEEGFLKEVQTLLYAGYTEDAHALQSVGYRELIAHLKGEMTLDEAVQRIKIATRQYAKRQMTWFKRDKKIKWVESSEQARDVVMLHYGMPLRQGL
ncbi:MAG: tRNA dimethylallyltransferase 2 [Candidatus Magasanikbacteria bacterium GW2011_GWA2_45_39]|uniref:tRNA dimethylallyltransferase n=1 Tax=Candidatus Magasanikbacteria bacterium GW2011_GWA2_45_39 TaxID=1619041 RepID=A0A0G1MIV5_9BACT|nr:MAG: tRNA dimethylallyltransferase 2 [Candidatus Magasanikbacteria bacterium GW2011_GWA2_45_39]